MKKKVIVILFVILGLLGLMLITFMFLNKCKKDDCKPCDTSSERVSTDQERKLEKMLINNEIYEFRNEQTDKYEQVITKSSCKTINKDNNGRYLMRCELNVTKTAIDNGQKYELTDYGHYFGYMETITGGKYRLFETNWYSDLLMDGLC